MAKIEETQAVPNPELTGIGGWLILPLIHLILNPLYLLWLVGQRLPDVAERSPAHAHAAQVGFILLMLPAFAFLIFCVVRFLQKRREVPWLMTVFYGFNTVVALVLIIARLKGYEYPDHIAGTSLVARHTLPTLTQLALSIGLIFYFHNSVRVANTFTVVGPSRKGILKTKGLGGWLILPLTAMAITVAVGAIAMIAGHFPANIAFAYTHGHWWVLARQALGVLLLLGWPSLSLYFACRKRRIARWLMIIYFALWAALFTAILVTKPVKNPAGIVADILCLMSIAYLLLSRRVKNTFVK